MICSECGKPVKARGLCQAHYARLRKHGDPKIVKQHKAMSFSVAERLALNSSEVAPDFSDPRVRLAQGCKPCRIYNGERNKAGYGRIRITGRKTLAHRAMFEEANGSIEDGFDLDHLCRNRACWELTHLEPVTPTENIRRGRASVADLGLRCRNGHDAKFRQFKYGRSRCLECRRESARARSAVHS